MAAWHPKTPTLSQLLMVFNCGSLSLEEQPQLCWSTGRPMGKCCQSRKEIARFPTNPDLASVFQHGHRLPVHQGGHFCLLFSATEGNVGVHSLSRTSEWVH